MSVRPCEGVRVTVCAVGEGRTCRVLMCVEGVGEECGRVWVCECICDGLCACCVRVTCGGHGRGGCACRVCVCLWECLWGESGCMYVGGCVWRAGLWVYVWCVCVGGGWGV